MASVVEKRSNWFYVLSIFLVLFGFATIKEGASVLFFDSTARAAAGHYVPFVLWFNFVAGFAYVLAGVGVGIRAAWSLRLSFAIAVLTAGVFVGLGVHIATGGLYEMRTVVAMSLRTSIWAFAALMLYLEKKKRVKAFNGLHQR